MGDRRIIAAAFLVGAGAAIFAYWRWNRNGRDWNEMTSAERVAAIRDERRSDADILIAALKDNDPDVRIVAAQHIGRSSGRETEGVMALVAALGDAHAGVRREAAEALCHLGAVSGPALCDALNDPNPRVRAGAALALGDVGFSMGMRRTRAPGEEAIIEPILKELLHDDDPEVRKNAAHALQVLNWDRRAP
jgi:HEAT repeat protein